MLLLPLLLLGPLQIIPLPEFRLFNKLVAMFRDEPGARQMLADNFDRIIEKVYGRGVTTKLDIDNVIQIIDRMLPQYELSVRERGLLRGVLEVGRSRGCLYVAVDWWLELFRHVVAAMSSLPSLPLP